MHRPGFTAVLLAWHTQSSQDADILDSTEGWKDSFVLENPCWVNGYSWKECCNDRQFGDDEINCFDEKYTQERCCGDVGAKEVALAQAFPKTYWHPPGSTQDRETIFAKIVHEGRWQSAAKGGPGSHHHATRELRTFLEDFLQSNGIRSVLDAGCGHWPTGFQIHMDWGPANTYVGVDIIESNTAENHNFIEDARGAAHEDDNKIKSMFAQHTEHLPEHLQDELRPLPDVLRRIASMNVTFQHSDYVSQELPAADLLLLKETLQHLPNLAIKAFLDRHVYRQPPIYKYVLFIHEKPNALFDVAQVAPLTMPITVRRPVDNWTADIPAGGYRSLDMSWEPFKLPVKTVFTYRGARRTARMLVQLYSPGENR